MKKDVKSKLLYSLFLMFIVVSVVFSVKATDTSCFNAVITDNGCAIVGCNKNVSGELVIPKEIFGKPVTHIGEKAFYQCRKITAVELPSTVVEIGNYAFAGCTELKSAVLPDSVKSVGTGLFSECYNLENVTLSQTLSYLPGESFYLCKNLQQISLPQSIAVVGSKAFYGCSQLKSIVLSEELETVFINCFENCTSLETVYIPRQVQSINEGAFENCDALKTVYFGGDELLLSEITSPNGNGKLLGADIVENHSHPDSAVITKTAADCTTDGYERLDCLCGYQKVARIIPSKGHDLSKIEILNESTCKVKGTARYSCVSCSYYKDEQLPLKAHNKLTDKEVKPSCSKSGLTKGSHCNACNKIIVKQEIVPALGHDYSLKIKDSKHLASKATYLNASEYYYTCIRCKKISTTKTFKGSKKQLEKVESISFTSTSETVTLEWEKVKNARGYAVYIKDANGKLKLIKRVLNNSFKVSELSTGKTYVFAVRAYVLEENKIVYAPEYKKIKAATKPKFPSKISVTQSTDSIMLQWSSVKGASAYRVYKYNSKTQKWSIIRSKVIDNKLILKNLKSGYRYKLAVRAYIDTGKKLVWSDRKTLTTCTKPIAPEVKSTAYKYAVKLEWDDVYGADGYAVYMSKAPNADFKKIGTTRKLSLKKEGLKSNTAYYFKVYAYRLNGDKKVYSYASTVKKVNTR